MSTWKEDYDGDIVKALRDYSEGPSYYWSGLCDDAADLIQELRNENKKLKSMCKADLWLD